MIQIPALSFVPCDSGPLTPNGLDKMLAVMDFERCALGPLLQQCGATAKLQIILEKLHGMVAFDLDHGPFIAGGILVRALLGVDNINDIDVFCCTEEQDRDVVKALTSINGDKGIIDESGSMGGGPHVTNIDIHGIKVQVVGSEASIAQTGADPRAVLASFDLNHCMLGTDGTTLLAHRTALDLVFGRKMIINPNSWRPERTEDRIQKYVGLGFENPAARGALQSTTRTP